MNKYEPALRPDGPDPDYAAISRDPRFRTLVARRSAFAWTLSGIMLALYLAFTLLVAFDKPLMATTPFGGVTSLGIILGFAVIVIAFGLTGLYVARANREFDRLAAAIRGDLR
ncbi:DUF485 domain-containing protein [Lichenihabitans sp. Uapishka_5]|uniref:DUF485 domain-containing protein n=1 Tax=Lichenihabitans sp. Uapishka_5 TaxID=3037302 RepID=UPI0029E80F8C|nr:DUF485 domain-containing protein [Lichenihabitans sp. Uapishka_5]MDX7953058.1 DUF485 domain-containing protein [Lichenihabitans sp. Uapishka_5]